MKTHTKMTLALLALIAGRAEAAGRGEDRYKDAQKNIKKNETTIMDAAKAMSVPVEWEYTKSNDDGEVNWKGDDKYDSTLVALANASTRMSSEKNKAEKERDTIQAKVRKLQKIDEWENQINPLKEAKEIATTMLAGETAQNASAEKDIQTLEAQIALVKGDDVVAETPAAVTPAKTVATVTQAGQDRNPPANVLW